MYYPSLRLCIADLFGLILPLLALHIGVWVLGSGSDESQGIKGRADTIAINQRKAKDTRYYWGSMLAAHRVSRCTRFVALPPVELGLAVVPCPTFYLSPSPYRPVDRVMAPRPIGG